MLVLSRTPDQVIRIGDDIEIVVIDIRGNKVRLGIKAPKSIPVHRQEVYEAIVETGVDRKAEEFAADGKIAEGREAMDYAENQRPDRGFTGLDMSELPRSAEEMLDGDTEPLLGRTCDNCAAYEPCRAEPIDGQVICRGHRTREEFDGSGYVTAPEVYGMPEMVDIGAVLQEIADCRAMIYHNVWGQPCCDLVRGELRKMELLIGKLAGVQL